MERAIRIDRQAVASLKGLAIVGVVGIHALTLLPGESYWGEWSWVVVFFDQIGRFSVPVFIFLSGFGLALKYEGRKVLMGEFLRHRFGKIIPLYLLWVGYFIALRSGIPSWSGVSQLQWWELLLFKPVEYHLYFVPIIIQLYVIFAVLKRWRSRLPSWLVGSALGIQILIYLFFSLHPGEYSDQTQYAIVLSWWGYFLLGVWLGERQRWVSRGVGWGLLLAGLAAMLFYTREVIDRGEEILSGTRFTKLPVIGYSLGVASWWLDPARVRGRWEEGLVWVGRWSYLIYLGHTVPLTLLKKEYGANELVWVGASYTLMVGVSIIWEKNQQRKHSNGGV